MDRDVYPGAGPGTLTPDGRLDPLLAYAYDAVYALAKGIRAEQLTANTWGSSLSGLVTQRCVFVSVAVGEGTTGIAPTFSRDEAVGLGNEISSQSQPPPDLPSV